MMTLGEKEKPVIQQGVYIVIKSHVKNANIHHPLSLSQHFLSGQLLQAVKNTKKQKPDTDLATLQQPAHLTPISIVKVSILA